MNLSDDSGDKALLVAIQQGDMDAFTTLMDKHKKYVLNVAYKYLHDRDAAEDLSQEVFVKVFQKSHLYKPVAKVSTWLYTITANLCLNYIRDNKKHRLVSLHDFGSDSQSLDPADTSKIIPHHQADADELRDVIWVAIEELPPQQRIAIVLYRFEEMSYQEISEILELSISALKSLIFRARATLAEKLHYYYKNL